MGTRGHHTLLAKDERTGPRYLQRLDASLPGCGSGGMRVPQSERARYHCWWERLWTWEIKRCNRAGHESEAPRNEKRLRSCNVKPVLRAGRARQRHKHAAGVVYTSVSARPP